MDYYNIIILALMGITVLGILIAFLNDILLNEWCRFVKEVVLGAYTSEMLTKLPKWKSNRLLRTRLRLIEISYDSNGTKEYYVQATDLLSRWFDIDKCSSKEKGTAQYEQALRTYVDSCCQLVHKRNMTINVLRETVSD